MYDKQACGKGGCQTTTRILLGDERDVEDVFLGFAEFCFGWSGKETRRSGRLMSLPITLLLSHFPAMQAVCNKGSLLANC